MKNGQVWIIALILICVTAGMSFAAGTKVDANTCVYRSSFTPTNDSAYIAGSVYLHSVIISSVSGGGGTCKIYDSTWTTTGQIANISLGTVNTYTFDKWLEKGLYYVITGNGSGLTMMWRKIW